MAGIEQLLTVARAYAAAEEIDLSTVSWRAMGDTKKLGAMTGGADIQVRRLERTMRWFSSHWPAGAAWPSDVPRPEDVPTNEPAEAAE